MTNEVSWSGKTGGTQWMQRSLLWVYRLVGLRVMYAVMALIVPFYMLFAHEGYISTYRFFRSRMHYGIGKAFVYVYRNHFVFGQVILDRFAAYAGRKFQLRMDGDDLFLEKAGGKDGFIMLSSHVGNYELAGYTLVSDRKPIKALVYGGETAAVMENRMRVLGYNNISLIPISDDLSHIFEMNNALANGEILSMSGDRVMGGKTFECDFMGGKAKFPAGPFVMAVERNVKMLAVFVMKESVNSYHVVIRELSSTIAYGKIAHKEEMRLLAQSFADELSSIVNEYPSQWFNYYNFWK